MIAGKRLAPVFQHAHQAAGFDVVSHLELWHVVAMEEVAPGDWTEQVYKPDIRDKWNTLTKKPGYDPLS